MEIDFLKRPYLAEENLVSLPPQNLFEHFIGLWNPKVWEPLPYWIVSYWVETGEEAGEQGE